VRGEAVGQVKAMELNGELSGHRGEEIGLE